MVTRLGDEIACYEANLRELFGEHPNKFVLIKGSSIIDIFVTELDAIKRGFERYGNEPFLVRRVTSGEAPILFTSMLMSV